MIYQTTKYVKLFYVILAWPDCVALVALLVAEKKSFFPSTYTNPKAGAGWRRVSVLSHPLRQIIAQPADLAGFLLPVARFSADRMPHQSQF